MKRLQGFLAVALGLLSCVAQGAVVFTDGDFTAWSFGAYAAGTGTATMVREAAGGNPGARVNVTTVTATLADTAYGTGIKTDYATTGQLQGTPFTLALDVLSGPGAFGQGQGINLLVEQGSSVYALALGITNVQASFATLSFSGTFNAAAFTRVSGAGPATPNLGGGVTTRFGFAAGNTGSGTLTQYYDNVSLDLAPVAVPPPPSPPAANIPTLSQWALILLAGLLGLVALGRLRDARR
jgi:hypothetical protein